MSVNVEAEISMKRYLLGELAEPQQLELEQGLMTSTERFNRLLVAEDELVDEYLRGTLSAREEEKFDDYFLCAPERRRKLRFFRSLRRYICSHGAQTFWRWPEFLTFRPFPHRIIEASLAAALSLIVLGGSWLTFRIQHLNHLLEQARSQTVPAGERDDGQRQQAQLLARNDQLTSEVQFHKGQRAVLEQELTRASALRRSSPLMIPFPLTSGTVRSGGEMKKVTIPPGATWVQLQLDLGASDYRKYQTVLQSAEAEEIANQTTPSIKIGNDVEGVVLTVPAKRLPYGDYSLKLSGVPAVGDPENIGSYTFRVLQK
jgi:cell division protein FtsB